MEIEMEVISKDLWDFMNRNIVFDKWDIISINNWEEIKEIICDFDLCIDMVKLNEFIHNNFKANYGLQTLKS